VGGDGPLDAPGVPRKPARKIARSPFKARRPRAFAPAALANADTLAHSTQVLDAPLLADDFYLNLVDWSAGNTLAVGLGACVYLWSACTCNVTKLADLAPGDHVTSVSWTQRGTYLAVGTGGGEVQLWDAAQARRVRTLGGHRGRVGSLAWSASTLASGSRDRTILQRDVRAPEDFTARLAGHRSEVCGLRWSPDQRELASGGNDNALCVWSPRAPAAPLLRFGAHTAAVKAIAWSPHAHGLLASGGGTADRCIRFWNTGTGASLACVDTGSQVCNLAWSKNVDELVSTHGYSQNQVVVWRYPTMSKIATLTGHTMRVLYLAVSPDGQTIVTGAGDETLRFWSVFPGPKATGAASDASPLALGRSHIR
jgi:cell division cycle 20-like protein 1 (cofactor of APC complex)